MENNVIKIDPLVSVNGVPFGTRRAEVWEHFGTPDCSFKKLVDDAIETDDYGAFHIYYDDGYRFEAMEIIAYDEVEVFYGGDRLPESYSEVLDYFIDKYPDTDEDDEGFITEESSVGVYMDNDEDEIDTILFGRKDYYLDN